MRRKSDTRPRGNVDRVENSTSFQTDPPLLPPWLPPVEGFHYVSPGIHRHPDVMTSLSLPRSFWRGSSYINDAILLGVYPCHEEGS